jgi:hypothetical protein
MAHFARKNANNDTGRHGRECVILHKILSAESFRRHTSKRLLQPRASLCVRYAALAPRCLGTGGPLR